MQRSLILLASAGASASLRNTTLVHVTYPVGAGPIINSVGIARHSSGDPTIAITTYLNPPNWVAAYNASSGTDSPSPMWTLSPSTPFSPSTIYFVDCARHQDDSGDKTSAVDTFSLLSEDNEYTGCTIQGSASNAGAGAAPRWNWTAPSCAAFLAQDQWRYIDASDDGSTLCAQLFEEGGGGVRYPVTHAFDAQTGKHLWARKLDASAGGYGVEVSDDGRWVVQGIDDSVKSVNRSAIVLSTADGSVRSRVAIYWNIPPAISGEGDFVVGGGSSNVMAYKWDASNSSYVLLSTPPLSPGEEAGWLPFDLTISTFTEPDGSVRHLLGATWIGYPDESHGRFTVLDLDAVAAGSAKQLLLDVRLDTDARQWDFAYVRGDGPYFVVGSAGGDSYFGAPTHWLFKVGEPAALWSFSAKGGATGIDVVQTAANTLWVAASGSQSPGGDGNGGDAYLWRFEDV